MKNRVLVSEVVQRNVQSCCKPSIIGIDFMFTNKKIVENTKY